MATLQRFLCSDIVKSDSGFKTDWSEATKILNLRPLQNVFIFKSLLPLTNSVCYNVGEERSSFFMPVCHSIQEKSSLLGAK